MHMLPGRAASARPPPPRARGPATGHRPPYSTFDHVMSHTVCLNPTPGQERQKEKGPKVCFSQSTRTNSGASFALCLRGQGSTTNARYTKGKHNQHQRWAYSLHQFHTDTHRGREKTEGTGVQSCVALLKIGPDLPSLHRTIPTKPTQDKRTETKDRDEGPSPIFPAPYLDCSPPPLSFPLPLRLPLLSPGWGHSARARDCRRSPPSTVTPDSGFAPLWLLQQRRLRRGSPVLHGRPPEWPAVAEPPANAVETPLLRGRRSRPSRLCSTCANHQEARMEGENGGGG